jgi:hypothetical protein
VVGVEAAQVDRGQLTVNRGETAGRKRAGASRNPEAGGEGKKVIRSIYAQSGFPGGTRMATIHRFLILLAVVALGVGAAVDYLGQQFLPILAPLTWLRLSGLLLLFAIAFMLDEIVTKMEVRK